MSVHLRLPLALAGDGSFRIVSEDSSEEIMQCVEVVLRTHPGERLMAPGLGVEDPTFVGFDAPTVLAVVREWEPRAEIEVVEQALTADGVQTSRLSMTKEG